MLVVLPSTSSILLPRTIEAVCTSFRSSLLEDLKIASGINLAQFLGVMAIPRSGRGDDASLSIRFVNASLKLMAVPGMAFESSRAVFESPFMDGCPSSIPK